ncbi:MAG: AAA family ATPase, partial [Cyanobacteriota bacterium]
MILEFTVKNFRSIENETFDLTSSKKIKEFPDNIRNIHNSDILTASIIYGRNASGKSNLLLAFLYLRLFVHNSNESKHLDKIIYYQPFEFDSLLKDKAVEFEITFITKDNLKFNYKISFNQKKIIFEALYYFPSNKPAKLFLREENKPISYGENYSGNKKNIENDLLENQLFLSKSATSNVNFLKEAYLFFKEEIYAHVFHESYLDEESINMFAEMIFTNKNIHFKENITNLLNAGDVNITKFEVEKP